MPPLVTLTSSISSTPSSTAGDRLQPVEDLGHSRCGTWTLKHAPWRRSSSSRWRVTGLMLERQVKGQTGQRRNGDVLPSRRLASTREGSGIRGAPGASAMRLIALNANTTPKAVSSRRSSSPIRAAAVRRSSRCPADTSLLAPLIVTCSRSPRAGSRGGYNPHARRARRSAPDPVPEAQGQTCYGYLSVDF